MLQSFRFCFHDCYDIVYSCIITPPPVGGRGIVFGRFLSLFLCQQHYEKTAGPICMKFSGKAWSDNGMTWLNFGSIRVNGSAGQRSSCLLSPAIAQSQLHLLGVGVCCAPHHSLLLLLLPLLLLLVLIIICARVYNDFCRSSFIIITRQCV